MAISSAAPAADKSDKDEPSLPYYASMKFPETNLRVGPGKDYPINWVYHRKWLPVQVIDQHQEWRNILDPYGDKGWVNKNQITLARSAVTIQPVAPLHSNPSDDSGVIANVESGVIGRMDACTESWCHVEMGDRKGWLPKSGLWGAGAGETFEAK